MITRKKIEKQTISWHLVLVGIVFILLLAGMVIFIYWYLFGKNNIIKALDGKPKTQQNTFFYPKHTLENVLKEKILNAN